MRRGATFRRRAEPASPALGRLGDGRRGGGRHALRPLSRRRAECLGAVAGALEGGAALHVRRGATLAGSGRGGAWRAVHDHGEAGERHGLASVAGRRPVGDAEGGGGKPGQRPVCLRVAAADRPGLDGGPDRRLGAAAPDRADVAARADVGRGRCELAGLPRTAGAVASGRAGWCRLPGPREPGAVCRHGESPAGAGLGGRETAADCRGDRRQPDDGDQKSPQDGLRLARPVRPDGQGTVHAHDPCPRG